MLVVVTLVLFKHLTDRLSNPSGTNISIPHNPVGLQAKSALYTGKNSNDTLGELTSSYQVLKGVAQSQWDAYGRKIVKHK